MVKELEASGSRCRSPSGSRGSGGGSEGQHRQRQHQQQKRIVRNVGISAVMLFLTGRTYYSLSQYDDQILKSIFGSEPSSSGQLVVPTAPDSASSWWWSSPFNNNETNSIGGIDNANSGSTGRKRKKTLHIMFGLMGGSEALYDAWEVALKSILLNAPTTSNVHIHLICNEKDAYQIIQDRMTSRRGRDAAANSKTIGGIHELVGSKWKNPIKITSYAISEQQNQLWEQFIRNKIQNEKLDRRVSLGGYYRVLGYQILKHIVKSDPVLYMDTDVIILRNMNDLMQYLDYNDNDNDNNIIDNNSTTASTNSSSGREWILQGDLDFFCSGFVVLYMERMEEFWEIIGRDRQSYLNNKTLDHDPIGWGDQTILGYIVNQYPHRVGSIPKHWQRNLGNGWYASLGRMIYEPDGAAMVHYQGGAGRKPDSNYFSDYISNNKTDLLWTCDRSQVCRKREWMRQNVRQTWNLGIYYINLPWRWAIHFGSSLIDPGDRGYPLVFEAVSSNITNKMIMNAASKSSAREGKGL